MALTVAACESDERRAARVTVPEDDESPPTATIMLASPDGRRLAEATGAEGERPDAVDLAAPRLRATATGDDVNGGVARVRVSISERTVCRAGGGVRFERPRRRYFPPPQVESIRATPGTRLPTRRRRSRLLTLAGRRCGSQAEAVEVRGRLWAEVINGSGLEAISAPIRFRHLF